MAAARPLYGQEACNTAERVRDTLRSELGWEQGRNTKVCILAEGGRPWVAIRWHCTDSCHSRVIRNQQNLFPIFLLLP